MSDSRPRHAVTLKGDLPDLERELLRRYCHELHGSDGSTLLQFLCVAVDPADPLYLDMDVVLPRRQGRRRLRLPHGYVFLIEDSEDGDATALPGSPSLLA